MRYLGILIHYRRLTLAEWKIVEERLKNVFLVGKANSCP
jgi:hypothetical protein